MAAAYRADALGGDGATALSSSLTLTIPASAVAGDVAYIAAAANTTATITTPTGWVKKAGADIGGSNLVTTYFWERVLQAGDAGTTVTLTLSASTRAIAEMAVLSGVTTTGAIYDAALDTANTTTASIPTETGLAAGTIFLVMFPRRTGTATAPDVVTPSGYTAGSRAATNFGTSVQLSCETAYKVLSSAGSAGGETPSVGANSVGATYVIALPPSSSSSGSGTFSGSGSGTVSVTGTPKPAQTVTLSGSGTLTVTGTPKPASTAGFSSTGTLNAQPGSSPQFSGSGALAAVPTGVAISTAVALSSLGGLSASAPVQVFLGGSGTLAATQTGCSFGPVFATLSHGEGQLDASGFGSLWHFTGPAILDYRPLELFRPGVGLIGWIPYGKSVWRDALGQWHEKYAPDIADLDGAQVVYGGGRIYPLTDAQRLDLIAGGYGNYITLEAIQ